MHGLQPDFGRRLRQQRTRAGLTQTQLAQNGLSQSYLSHLEAGRREPSPETVQRLAAPLDVDATTLTGETAPSVAPGLVLLGRADMHTARGEHEAAAGLYEMAARDTALQASGDWLRPVQALAEARERLGDLDGAVRLLEAALPRATSDAELALGDGNATALTAFARLATALARCYRESGDLSRAVDVASAAGGIVGAARPRPAGYAQLTATLASAYADRGDLTRASHLLDGLLEDARSAQDLAAEAAANWNAALVAAERGQTLDALRLIDRAAWLVTRQEDLRAVARVRVSQAWLLMLPPAPDPSRAEALLLEAMPDLERHAARTDVASARTELARACLALGRADEAADNARAAEQLLKDQPNLESARAAAVLGQGLLALGDHEGGRGRLDLAARILSGFGSTREAAGLWRSLAEAYRRAGLTEQALEAFAHAMDTLGLRGDTSADDSLLTTYNAGL